MPLMKTSSLVSAEMILSALEWTMDEDDPLLLVSMVTMGQQTAVRVSNNSAVHSHQAAEAFALRAVNGDHFILYLCDANDIKITFDDRRNLQFDFLPGTYLYRFQYNEVTELAHVVAAFFCGQGCPRLPDFVLQETNVFE